MMGNAGDRLAFALMQLVSRPSVDRLAERLVSAEDAWYWHRCGYDIVDGEQRGTAWVWVPDGWRPVEYV